MKRLAAMDAGRREWEHFIRSLDVGGEPEDNSGSRNGNGIGFFFRLQLILLGLAFVAALVVYATF